MTDSHHVVISSYPLDDKFSQLDISCSCGETLLSGKDEVSVEEANNFKWQHLVKHMPPLEDVPVHGGCDSPDCKWCNIQPPNYYLREI